MFRAEKTTTPRVLATLMAIFTVLAATAGIVSPSIYDRVADETGLPFCVGQDVVSLAAALALLVVVYVGRRPSIKLDILQIGIVSYLLYAYGPMVMGTLYTPFYYAYLAVFGLTIFYFIYALAGIDYGRLDFRMPTSVRGAVATYCAVMPVLWVPQWIDGIWQQIQADARPTDFGIYWVYVLDLCFVMPVCALAAIWLLQKKPLGYVLGGVLSVMGFVLMLSVAMGGFLQPHFDQAMGVGGLGGVVMFSGLSLVFLVLSVLYFARTRISFGPGGGDPQAPPHDVAVGSSDPRVTARN